MELERYRELAHGTALALLGDHHLAEDAVQDAFVEAHRSWGSLRDPAKRAAWVRAIVRRRAPPPRGVARSRVALGRLLEAFLTTPFDVGREMTGAPGQVVPLAATLDGVEAILKGDLDGRDPKEISYIGAL